MLETGCTTGTMPVAGVCSEWEHVFVTSVATGADNGACRQVASEPIVDDTVDHPDEPNFNNGAHQMEYPSRSKPGLRERTQTRVHS